MASVACVCLHLFVCFGRGRDTEHIYLRRGDLHVRRTKASQQQQHFAPFTEAVCEDRNTSRRTCRLPFRKQRHHHHMSARMIAYIEIRHVIALFTRQTRSKSSLFRHVGSIASRFATVNPPSNPNRITTYLCRCKANYIPCMVPCCRDSGLSSLGSIDCAVHRTTDLPHSLSPWKECCAWTGSGVSRKQRRQTHWHGIYTLDVPCAAVAATHSGFM